MEGLYFYNPWWETGKVPSGLLKKYHRPVVNDLKSYLSIDRIVIVKGARRTGKTTIFYQMIEELLRNGIPPRDILYISFDDIKMREDFDNILKIYQEVNRRLIKEGLPVYILMDEVHFLSDWQFFVKKYFDRKYPLKFIISGSAATLIRKGTESLAGRTAEETVYPFSFYEFLSLRMQDSRLIDKINQYRKEFRYEHVDTSSLLPYATELRVAFQEYAEKGGFPGFFDISDAQLWKRLAREDILEKVIYRDLVELYDIKKPEVLERLFLYLAGITSQILSITNIANSLGLSREYTERYIYYLEQAFLIKRLKKYAKSVEKTVRSAEKVHLMDSGLINAVAKVAEGQVIESMTAGHLIRRRDTNIFYHRDRYEVDLVLERERELLPIEVKYTDNITRKDLKGIGAFMRNFGAEKGIVVSRDLLKEETYGGLRLVYLPAWLFMAMTG